MDLYVKKLRSSGQRQCPAPPAALLALTQHDLWEALVVPYLDPRDLIRLSHVCWSLREHHTRDELWEPWVAQIESGRYLHDLGLHRPRSLSGRLFKDAYLVATTLNCSVCDQWTRYVHLPTLRKLCWACFRPPRPHLPAPPPARDSLPRSVHGHYSAAGAGADAHRSRLKRRTDCSTSKLGLSVDRTCGWIDANVAYRASLEAHQILARGPSPISARRPLMQSPTMPGRLAQLRELTAAESDERARRDLLSDVRFPRKDKPWLPVGEGVVYCRYCVEADPEVPEYQWAAYPSQRELAQSHLRSAHALKPELLKLAFSESRFAPLRCPCLTCMRGLQRLAMQELLRWS